MKKILRIILVLLAVPVALLLVIAASVAVDYVLGGDRLETISNTMIPGVDGGPDVSAYVARPDGPGPFPAVIMIHEFYGLNESITGKADGLAEQGYLVVAPDTFRGSTTSWIPRAIYQVITTRTENVNSDLDSVYAWLESQPDVASNKIGVLGFCYGGRASLQYSLHNNRIAATVVFYGSPETDPQVLQNLSGPILGIFGGADQSISVEEVQAFEDGLRSAGIPHEVTIYEGQPHAFVTDMDSIRSGGVQAEAWEQMVRFLDENLLRGESNESEKDFTYTPRFPIRYYAMLVYEHVFGSASHHH
jgi:carboxymethylenebutenolidase